MQYGHEQHYNLGTLVGKKLKDKSSAKSYESENVSLSIFQLVNKTDENMGKTKAEAKYNVSRRHLLEEGFIYKCQHKAC